MRKCSTHLRRSTCSVQAHNSISTSALNQKCFNSVVSSLESLEQNRSVAIAKESGKFNKYAECLASFSRLYSKSCLPKRKQLCESKTIHVFKVIRLPIEFIDDLVASRPNVKVIYQYRDPRGIISSRLNRSPLMTHSFRKELTQLCASMLRDVLYLRSLPKHLQRHVLYLRYEDLAFDPVNEARRVYDAIGESLPVQVTSWLRKATSSNVGSSSSRNRPFSTFRDNSTRAAVKWQQQLSAEQKRFASNVCKGFLTEMNYSLDV